MWAFFEPLRGELKKKHFFVLLLGAMGLLPANYFGRNADTIWVGFGILILWWFAVVMLFCTCQYFKNKSKKQ
ncbi:MAG: hypothetical protein ILA04_06470 [Prevotella sp.]|nr:hypothetical protein [Prevotella sp.]